MNTNPPSDLMYQDMEDITCPFDHECETCEWDCGEDTQ